MKKLFICAAIAMTCISMQAGAATPDATPVLSSTRQLPLERSEHLLMPQTVDAVQTKAPLKVASADTEWNDWRELGTASFPESLMNNYNINIRDIYGIDVPEWDGSITVMQRESSTDENTAQLWLKGMFGNADIILDVDLSTCHYTCGLQPTGIKTNPEMIDPSWFSEFMFNTTGSPFYYAESGTIQFGNFWMMINTSMGVNLGGCTLQIDGIEPVKFSMSAPSFVSSKNQPAAEITVNRSAKVDHYRVITANHTQSILVSTVADLMRPVPTDTTTIYQEFSGDSFTLDFSGDGPDKITVVAIPFNADNKCVSNYSMRTIIINRPDSHSWTKLGQASMTDILGHVGMPASDVFDFENQELLIPAQTRNVEIEASTDCPGLYRIANPFGKGYPMYDKLTPLETDEDFYLYVDASDPSRVTIPFSLSGFYTDNGIGYITSQGYNYKNINKDPVEEIDLWNGRTWGKMFDKKISFNDNTVFVSNMHSYSGSLPDLEICLPGYEPYEMVWANDVIDENGNIILSASDNITSIDCALVNASEFQQNTNMFFPEVVYDKISSRADSLGVKTINVVNGQSIINIPELESLYNGGYGWTYVVAVPRDAAGETHHGLTGPMHNVAHPDNKWKSIGRATIEENAMFVPYGSIDVYSGTCEVEENITQPGLYKLINPYYEISFNNAFGQFNYAAADIYIDATNPSRVNFVVDYTRAIPSYYMGISTGLNISYGEQYINTLGNYYQVAEPQTELIDDYYGKKQENVISFEGKTIVIGIPGANYIGFNDATLFRVTLPVSAGIDSIVSDDDNDAEAEYYNLQGIKVTNPSGGIFIERRGSKTSKRYIP